MFNIIKKWFRKTENFENNENFSESQIITFSDLKAQNITIEVRQNGNNTILVITENKSKIEIILDKEQCILLSALFSEYFEKGNINKFVQLLKSEGK